MLSSIIVGASLAVVLGACSTTDEDEPQYRAAFDATVAQDFLDGFQVTDLRPAEEQCIRDAMWQSIGRSMKRDVSLQDLETGGPEVDRRFVTAAELRAFTDLLARADCLDWLDLYGRTPEVQQLVTALEGTVAGSTLDCYLAGIVGSSRWPELLYEQYAANMQSAPTAEWAGEYLTAIAEGCGFPRQLLVAGYR